MTGFYVWRKGNKVARLFLIAWLPFFIAINLFILRIFGFIERLGMEIIYITQLANALEAVIFSFALADKVNILKEQVRANLEKSNYELELKVKERTGELNNTLSLIRQDLNFAKKIQTRLLPGQAFQVENLKIVSRYIPMDEVGGDFFDIAKLENNIVRILIADATGHGVQGALVTMLIKSEYEVLKESFTSTSQLMKKFNNLFFTKYSNLYSFFTCFIVDIDMENETITYTSAGHSGQLFISGNDIKVLERTGKIPGVMKDADFQEVRMKFRRGDKLLLFTDGIFEEFNKKEEEFGEDKLHHSVKSIATEKIDIILEECLKKMNEFLGNEAQQDDITLIGVEWN
jgi:serine phosphatase RsbU (regulator of sigma subunit)